MGYMVAHVEHIPRRPQPRVCFTEEGEHKMSHRSKAEAKAYLRTVRGKSWRRDGLEVYRCWRCRKWHSGHGR